MDQSSLRRIAVFGGVALMASMALEFAAEDLFDPLVHAGEPELARARQQFVQQALKNPSQAGAAYQASVVPARRQASQQAVGGLFKNINRGVDQVLGSMTSRVARFFRDSQLISSELLSGWLPGSQRGSAVDGAGARSQSASKGLPAPAKKSGPPLKYEGPAVLDYRNVGNDPENAGTR